MKKKKTPAKKAKRKAPSKKEEHSALQNSINIVRESIEISKKTIIKWWMPILCDILFFFGAGFLIGGFGSKIVEFLQIAGAQIVKESQSMQQVQSIWELIRNDPLLSSLALKAIVVLALLLISLYIWFSLVQGWLWASMLSWTQKVKKNQYLKDFFIVNVFWAGAAILYLITHFIFTLQYTLAKNIDKIPLAQAGQWSVIFTIVAGILLVWSAVSYILIINHKPAASMKQSVKLIMKNGSTVLILMIGVGMFLWVLNKVLEQIMQGSLAGTVISVIIVLPLMVWLRILAITMVKNLQ